MLGKKQNVFTHPEGQMLLFDSIFKQVSALPLHSKSDASAIHAMCHFNQKTANLTVYARTLQKGQVDAPLIIYLPWYGGKSRQSKQFFDFQHHPHWTYIGIDIFNTKEEFKSIVGSAVVSQHAYALVMRMMAEQVRLAHAARRKVGIAGISYGANVLSAYTTRGLELPDAIVAVEGGNILQITLQTKYKGYDSDPRTLRALEREPGLLPIQVPVTGKAAAVSATVINPGDKIVLGQEELWKSAAEKVYIRGTHVTALLLNRRKISRFASRHFERQLIA